MKYNWHDSTVVEPRLPSRVKCTTVSSYYTQFTTSATEDDVFRIHSYQEQVNEIERGIEYWRDAEPQALRFTQITGEYAGRLQVCISVAHEHWIDRTSELADHVQAKRDIGEGELESEVYAVFACLLRRLEDVVLGIMALQ